MAYSTTHLKAMSFMDKQQIPAGHVDAFLATHSRDSLEACTRSEVISITQSLTGVHWDDIPKWGTGGRNTGASYGDA